MNSYQIQIEPEIIMLARRLLEMEDKAIARLIFCAWRNGRKITQRNLAISESWIGAHPRWETKAINAGFIQTSERRVRQIVHDLRVDSSMPIISDDDGYCFPFSKEDGEEYIERVALEVEARNKSSLETLDRMRTILGVL